MRSRPAIFITMILATVALIGCAKTGMQRSAATGTTMESVENDIRQIIAQVDVTGAALKDLTGPGQADVKKGFNQYSTNVSKMEDLEKRFSKHADTMRAQGKEYFEEWRTEGAAYKNPQIQALSEQRRADLTAVFAQITEASVGVKGSLSAYMSDIREIQNYLSNDLTPKGIDAITPVARKAVMDGERLKEAMYPVLFAIGNAREELAQGGTK